MAKEHTTGRRRSVRTTLLTIVAVAAVAAGLAAGIQSFHAAANASAIGAVSAPTPAVNDPAGGGTVSKPANGAARPLDTSGVTPQACRTMEEAKTRTTCGFPRGAHYVAPTVSWAACEAMDETTYRQLCHQGDGGRWIEGSQPARP